MRDIATQVVMATNEFYAELGFYPEGVALGPQEFMGLQFQIDQEASRYGFSKLAGNMKGFTFMGFEVRCKVTPGIELLIGPEYAFRVWAKYESEK